MDDVEAARAEPEIERRDVDDDLVALAHLPQQHLVGPGRPPLAVDLDHQRVGGDDDAAAQLRAGRSRPVAVAPASATIPSQTSSILSRLRGRDASRRRCGRRRCRWRAGRSRSRRGGRRWRRCRRRSPPAAARARPRAGPPRRAPAPRESTGSSVAAEQLFDPHVDVAAVLARAPGAGVGDLPGDLRRPLGVEAARLGVDAAVAGDDVARGAALDQADVGRRLLVEPPQLHPRDRRRGGRDRAAAVLGPDPGVGLDPGEVGEDLLLGRRRDDHLADRPGVVEDEAASGAQLARRRRPWRRAGPAPRRRSAAARSRPAAAPRRGARPAP